MPDSDLGATGANDLGDDLTAGEEVEEDLEFEDDGDLDSDDLELFEEDGEEDDAADPVVVELVVDDVLDDDVEDVDDDVEDVDEEDDDLEDELDEEDDDLEDELDELLEEDEEVQSLDEEEGGAKKAAKPRRKVELISEDEFTCSNCFLVKKPSQLADREAMLCFDCI